MQGILIVSADAAVRKSLAAMLQSGRAIRECQTISECLELAAAEKFDTIFVDDVYRDGAAPELVSRLHGLGYGIEVVPILFSLDHMHRAPFLPCGVRHFIAKPFNVQDVHHAVDQIEEMARLSDAAIEYAQDAAAEGMAEAAGPMTTPDIEAGGEIDVREISQRFRRLLARLQSREDLVRAFADSMQEQFDVDNVVVLLPAAGRPAYDIACGSVSSEVREQFFLPMDEPLMKTLVRLGEPVWIHDCARLGRQNALSAIRYGERLGIQVFCPVLSRGRLRAIVGLSRFHRYTNSLALMSLLRLFLTFFAEALENSELYERMSAAGATYKAMFEALEQGAIAVSQAGRIQYVNPAAASILGKPADELVEQVVEKAGSMLAHCARETLDTGAAGRPRTVSIAGRQAKVSATPLAGDGGALVLLRPADAYVGEDVEREAAQPAGVEIERLWGDMAQAIAHNFKNAFVPVQTCAELLPQRYEDESFREFFLETVSENIHRINTWIDQLLSFSRVDEEDEWGEVALGETIDAALDQAEKQYPQTQVTFKRNYTPEVTVGGSAAILERTFLELFRNALEAVQDVPEPVIQVTTNVTDDQVCVDIEDNGSGVDEEIKELMFEPFASKKLSGGLGLGLSYARRAAGLHGGHIDLSERSEGDGTVVRLSFPAVKVAVANAESG